MKTLTIWGAYLKLLEHEEEARYISQHGGDTGWWAGRGPRQIKKFKHALTKRLQEQEEELEGLRAYENDTKIFLAIHGFDFAEWEKGYEDYLKEKTTWNFQ